MFPRMERGSLDTIDGGRVPMSINVGMVDRIVRIVIGIALLSLVFVGPKSLWGMLGLIPLLTGISGYCPAYRLLHTSTRGPTEKHA